MNDLLRFFQNGDKVTIFFLILQMILKKIKIFIFSRTFLCIFYALL